MKKITKPTERQVDELLTRGVSEVIDKEDLKKKLLSGKRLRIKLGIDPTSPNLHLGRSVTLLKMRDLQQLGHKIVFIIGDFTGVIGDTSDKESERPMLSEKQVKENMKSYVKQVKKLLDIEKAEIHHNSSWLKKLGYKEISKQADQFSVTEFISRENIKKRLDQGARVSLREVLYPLMQGYDSVAIKADLELGGTDQRFNLLAGRKLQQFYGQAPQNILMVDLIPGTDGRKMSSSWGNTINLLDEPDNMFGKVMSIPDDLIITYFKSCTRVPMEEVDALAKALFAEEINPRDVKMKLAFEITKIYWGEKKAQKAQENFVKIFQKKQLPQKMKVVPVNGKTILDALVLSKLAASKSDARRLLNQKSIKINHQTVSSIEHKVTKGDIIQKGKRFFVKVG